MSDIPDAPKPPPPPTPSELVQVVKRLTKDMIDASTILTDTEARFLVDGYYQMQGNRIRAAGQIRSMKKDGEPHAVLAWLAEQSMILEKQLERALDKYSANHVVGQWLRDIDGIGAILAAGVVAHIDIHQAPTAGHIWSFAGLNPNAVWESGKKRPWNADLKVLCWKIGESFVKRCNAPTCFYGQIYKQRKELEITRNEAGAFAEQAKRILENKNFKKDTIAYQHYIAGKLPPAHIHARAKRYAVKLLLAHVHAEFYRRVLKQEPPFPYVISHLGHVHHIDSSEAT